MKFERVDLTVDELAQLLHVQGETVRRRLRAGELRAGAEGMVHVAPLETWVRVEDAAALLSVSPATVRSNIKRGRLNGRREKHGRWRVQLSSVLEDRRVNGDALAVFTTSSTGDASSGGEVDRARRSTRRARASRDTFLRLYDDETELLERGVDRHGSIRAAVVAGLRAIDNDDAATATDLAELRSAHELATTQLERVRAAHAGLSAHAHDHLIEKVYCPRCEEFIPVDELGKVGDGLHCGRHRYRKPLLAIRRAAIAEDASLGDRRDASRRDLDGD